MTERNYGIDLLRLVLMYMVCILHTLGQGGVLGSCISRGEYGVFWLLEIVSYCAVDGFAIISGYMAKDKPQKHSKLVEMWFQVFFYSFVLTVVLAVFGLNDGLSSKKILKLIFPVTFNVFWYFTAYFALFFAIPLLNKFLFTLDELASKKAFLGLIILFSLLGIISDPFRTNWGYSALWLIVLYCIGALAKRIKLFEEKKTSTLVLLWIICIFCTWSIKVFIGIGRLANYVSPTILMSGLLMVILFSRLNLKGKIIAKLSPLAFGIYLFQLNQIIWNNVLKDAFTFVPEKNLIIGVGCIFLFSFGVFWAGLLVEFIRSKLALALRIPALSNYIVCAINRMMTKLFFLLK